MTSMAVPKITDPERNSNCTPSYSSVTACDANMVHMYFWTKQDVGLCIVSCFEKWNTRVNL
jgi:hypothetical protein